MTVKDPRWLKLFEMALPECNTAEEAVYVADLAFGQAMLSLDPSGHEHRGKGEGGGQFVKQGDGGDSGESSDGDKKTEPALGKTTSEKEKSKDEKKKHVPGARASAAMSKYKELITQAKRARVDAFNSVNEDANEALSKAESHTESMVDSVGEIITFLPGADADKVGFTKVYNKLDNAVMALRDADSMQEKFDALEEISATGTKTSNVLKKVKPDPSNESALTAEEIASNGKHLSSILQSAKAARGLLKEYVQHRKEMKAIKSGDDDGGEIGEQKEQLISKAKQARIEAFNSVKKDAGAAQEKAEGNTESMLESVGEIINAYLPDSGNVGFNEAYDELDTAVMALRDADNIRDKMDALEDIGIIGRKTVKALKKVQPVIRSSEDEAGLTEEEIANNGKHLSSILTAAKASRGLWKEYVQHRKEMKAIKSGDEGGAAMSMDDGFMLAIEPDADDDEDDSEHHTEDLAGLYADLWHGQHPKDLDAAELHTAYCEMDGGTHGLSYNDDDGWTVVKHGGNEIDAAFAVHRAPKGKPIQIDGKTYKPGMFIPGDKYAKATPEEKAAIDHPAKAAKEARTARGSVDHGKLSEKVAKHGHHELTKTEHGAAKRAFAALHRHHGELTLHRLEELADKLQAAHDRTPEDEEGQRAQFSRRIRAIGYQIDMAKAKGVTGEVKATEQPKEQAVKNETEEVMKKADEIVAKIDAAYKAGRWNEMNSASSELDALSIEDHPQVIAGAKAIQDAFVRADQAARDGNVDAIDAIRKELPDLTDKSGGGGNKGLWVSKNIQVAAAKSLGIPMRNAGERDGARAKIHAMLDDKKGIIKAKDAASEMARSPQKFGLTKADIPKGAVEPHAWREKGDNLQVGDTIKKAGQDFVIVAASKPDLKKTYTAKSWGDDGGDMYSKFQSVLAVPASTEQPPEVQAAIRRGQIGKEMKTVEAQMKPYDDRNMSGYRDEAGLTAAKAKAAELTQELEILNSPKKKGKKKEDSKLSIDLQPADDLKKNAPNFNLSAYFAHDIYSRRAQGVLNKTIDVSKRMTASARTDLSKTLRTQDPTELSRGLLAFISKYRAQLIEILTTAQLASLLEGAREVAKRIPVVPMFPGAARPPATLDPAKAMDLLNELRAMPVADREKRLYELPGDQQSFIRQGLLAVNQGGDQPPGPFVPASPAPEFSEKIHYPIIDEAARGLAEKNVLSRYQFDSLDAAARQKAFTIANVESMDTIDKIRTIIAETIHQGVDLQTFRERVMAAAEEGTFMSNAHLETVYRTTVQTAFSDGQMKVLQHPFVRSGYPYAAYEAIHDDRVRPHHAELETLGIQGTNIYRIDDPVFITFRPPWDYCLSGDTTVITRRGHVRIDEVKAGDKVLTHKGRFRSVLETHRNEGVDELIEITAATGSIVRSTAEHPFLTPNGWVDARTLNVGDTIYRMSDDEPYTLLEVTITNLRRIPWSDSVYNLTVEDDQSFICNGIASHNCDRCSWIPMTVRMAASKGIEEAKLWLETGEEPSPKAFVPMPNFRPPPGFQRSLTAAPLSIQMAMRPMQVTLEDTGDA